MFTSFLLCSAMLTPSQKPKPKPIDRRALVTRHNIELTNFNETSPLQVGNGEFAFGMDATGLQTFVPFNTMAQWGWHSGPLPAGKTRKDFKGQVIDTHGRPIRYPMFDPNEPALSSYLAASPHRINLGRIGLNITLKNGKPARKNDIKKIHQWLNLYTGIVTSLFEVEGLEVSVQTACHPTQDQIGVKVRSNLIRQGRLSVFFDCPGNDPQQFANLVGDWTRPGQFIKTVSDEKEMSFVRQIDSDEYSMKVAWSSEDTTLKPTTPKAAPKLRVISAMYGAGDKRVDLTKQVQNAVKDGQVRMRIGNSLVSEDPAPKVVKNLVVVYSLDGDEETVQVPENGELHLGPVPTAQRFVLSEPDTNVLEFVCAFSPKPITDELTEVEETFEESQSKWAEYWNDGGVIDLSQSKDPRWKELERRIVLSQYLMKVNEAGSLPPQESGLVNNGWFGKFHMEMMWWHATHWALWNKWVELEPSLSIYQRLLPKAKALAASQGYKGARWPKCLGPDFVEWPHEIHSFLNWQQPHPIFFAELDYRAHPTKATLKKWQPIVEATADYLATYAFNDPVSKQFVLGPPIHLVSENTNPLTTKNPTFELGYWRFGLRTANAWRKRMGLAPNKAWANVQAKLAPLPQQNGLYVLHEGVEDMWTKWTFEHPALTGVYGMLPGDGVDKAAMRRTFDQVVAKWDFNRTWGWDFPMLAMCAARVGRPEKAIDMLLHKSPGFQFDERGLATGGPFPYFPSNGGLLYAVAMMAKGWDGSTGHAPGFPKNGQWVVKVEGISPAL